MDMLRNMRYLFTRKSRKNDICFTEVTVLKNDVFRSFNKSNDLVEFTDMRCRRQRPTTKPSPDPVQKSVRPTYPIDLLREYRVSPLVELRAKQPVYTQEDLDRIAEMFIVSYTHYTSEDELPSYQARMSQKKVKRGRHIFQQLRKLIS